MQSYDYYLDQLCNIFGIDLLCYAGERFWDYREHIGYNPLREEAALREKMIDAAGKQEEPLLILEEHEVIFACVRQKLEYRDEVPSDREAKAAYFLLGPMALGHKTKVELHRYYRDYHMKKGTEYPIPVLPFTKILALVELVAGILTEVRYTHEQLIAANHLDADPKKVAKEEQKRFSVLSEEQLHHSYEEERRLLNAVREGRADDAVDLSMMMDARIGIMSKNEMLQRQKLAAVSIALSTRAAMEGGLSPTEAYRISDYYNQKCDRCKDEGELLDCRNLAIRALADSVRKKMDQSAGSGYIEICCDYIEKHYRETIRLGEIAESIGLNPSYLSRIFSREMGMKMQEYILRVRVEHAANMLKYSDLEVARIGDYVNFPSQSYFGRVFKKYMQMTPAKYRNRYRSKEFQELKK